MSSVESAVAVGAVPVAGIKTGSRSRPLRVLTLTPFYPSLEDTARGCFIAEPLTELEHRGVSTDVIAVRPFYRGNASLVPSEISTTWRGYFSIPGNLGLPLAGKFLAVSLMQPVRRSHFERQFDLIHAHGALPCGHAAAILSKRLGIPFLVTVHGLDVFSTTQAGVAMGSWCKKVSQWVYSSARQVICISDKVRQRITEVQAARTMVVYNGVDVSRFYPGSELRSPLIALSVGNLIPIKGHALLLRAFARVYGVAPECRLEIIGDGPERSQLCALADQFGISSHVSFLGRQSRDDVAAAMRRCALFVLPSGYEGLGCVYLEAMASGKPVIGCLGQGIDEIIAPGQTGLLISPGSEDQLSEAVRTLLLNGQLRARIGSAARDAVLSHHTVARQAGQLAQIYSECAR